MMAPLSLPSSYGQFHDKCCPLARLAFCVDFAAMFGDYTVADTQTKPGALAYFLGGEERVKQVSQMLLFYTRAIIGK